MTEEAAKTPNGKTTKAEIIKRVEKVLELLIAGATRSQVLQYASEKTDWNVSTRTVDTYIAKSNKMLEAEAAINYSREYGKGLRRLNNLYQKCLQIQDFKGALAVQKEINELAGAKKPMNDDGDGTNKLLIEWTTSGKVKINGKATNQPEPEPIEEE